MLAFMLSHREQKEHYEKAEEPLVAIDFSCSNPDMLWS